MNTHRLLALTICIAALNASQTVFSQSKVKSSLCTSANSVETIREQIEGTRTFDDNRQRLRVLLRSADLLWPYRRPAARAAFAEAFELANLNFKNKDPKKGNPASAPDQRYLVISAIAKRDLDWATKLTEQLLKEEAKQLEEAAAKTSQDDLATAGKLLDTALYLLPSNVNAAMQFARRSFSFPASLGLPIFLYKLAELDQPAADRLYAEAVAVYRNEPMNEFLYLSAYPFGNDREAGDMPAYASYRVPSGFVRRNALQRLFLETLLLRSQQTLANIQPVPTQASDTRQIWFALTRLEPQVQQFLPDLLAATQQARETVFTHLSPDYQERVTRSIANQNQPKKSFDEQVEAAEKQANVDERDRLLVFAVLGVSETEPLDRVVAVAEKISDSTVRRQLLDWIYFGRSRSAIKDKQFVEARRRASKVEELDQRAYLYSQIAEEFLKTIDDQTQARELLEEVIAAAAQAPNTIVTARTLLAAAFLYTKVDMNRAVSVIGDAIKSINRLTAPDFSRPVVTRKIEGKEFGAYTTFQTPGFDPENTLRALGKIDFDTAFYQVSSFEDKYLRALTTLTLVEQCLEPPRPQRKR
jgi:hypothetical protein